MGKGKTAYPFARARTSLGMLLRALSGWLGSARKDWRIFAAFSTCGKARGLSSEPVRRLLSLLRCSNLPLAHSRRPYRPSRVSMKAAEGKEGCRPTPEGIGGRRRRLLSPSARL